MLSDTHPDAERVQIELLRQMTPEQRLATAFGLSAAMITSSREAIRAANPQLSPRELDMKQVELYYGPELASRLRAYLAVQQEPSNAVR